MRSFISGSFSARPTNTPMRRIRSGCCARAASGQIAAAQLRSMMNSRRLIVVPDSQDRASYRGKRAD